MELKFCWVLLEAPTGSLLCLFQEECMIRYKTLAELVQKRKQAKS